jgi:hypothetical protein
MRSESAGHTLQATALVHEAYLQGSGLARPNGKIGLPTFLSHLQKGIRVWM